MIRTNKKTPPSKKFTSSLLAWYDLHGRHHLPWRQFSNPPIDPYPIWVAEIMLQQTTVKTVTPYFIKFLHHWPSIKDLAKADLDEVLLYWSGLGYYARARNLHQCARLLVSKYDQKFPQTVSDLQKLPGVGSYTASSLAAIAFQQPVPVVDGNIERIVTRIFALVNPLDQIKSSIPKLLFPYVPKTRPGDFAQALMDLGATICTPTSPKCCICPVSLWCQGRLKGIASSLPYKSPKKSKPIRYGIIFWVHNALDQVLLHRRPQHGLLGGMVEIPSTPWYTETFPDQQTMLQHAPLKTQWKPLEGIVHHTFTHFHLQLLVVSAKVSRKSKPTRGFWSPYTQLKTYPLPTAMWKVIRHVKEYKA